MKLIVIEFRALDVAVSPVGIDGGTPDEIADVDVSFLL